MIAVIMCGGMGTRMQPITDLIPKPLLQVGGREILDILIEKLIDSGADTIFLTIGYKGEMIQDFVEKKQYPAKIRTVYESSPLGTAGGVRNAVGQTMEDVLVISGDNIFSFDLTSAYREHLSSGADVSLIGTICEDPRSYGTVQMQADGTINSFIEKPSWSQAESNIINTGIYFIKGEIVSLIPTGKMYDFANDLFPALMKQGHKLHCILAEGIWGDLGDIGSFLEVNKQVLHGNYGSVCHADAIYKNNKILPNGSIITAPCIIDQRVHIGPGCKIGPFSIIGKDCEIGAGSIIENTIVAADCKIGEEVTCTGAYIGAFCELGAFVKAEPRSVLAGHIRVGNYAVIDKAVKISAGCAISENEYVSEDRSCDYCVSVCLTAAGLSGKPMRELYLHDMLNVGCAVASCKQVKRIGISDDGNILSVLFKNAISVGLQSCGATVYDFGDIIRSQRVFFSQYCKLDFFISVTENNDSIIVSFCSRNGSPVDRKTERELQAAYRYKQFRYAVGAQCKEVFMMNPLTAVYKSVLMHKLASPHGLCSVAVECDNRNIYELMQEILREKQYSCNYGGLLFMIDRNGEKFYAVENERAFSYDRILTICCHYELKDGSDIVVGETAPGILEELARVNGRTVFRFYEADTDATNEQIQKLLGCPWVFDGLSCIVRLLTIMQNEQKSLQQLSDEIPEWFVKNMSFVYNGEPKHFKEKLTSNGAVKSETRNGYYEWEDERGSVKIKADSACRLIKVLIESDSIELSRELAADAEIKLKNCAIDKF